MKDKFSDIYSEEIKERIVKASSLKNIKPVFRTIHHSRENPITKCDFYPTIMQYANNTMPPYDKQNRKTNIENFGVSVYLSKEQLIAYTNFVPSERNSEKFIAVGMISPNKGAASEADSTGHINYYLFDPINDEMNCYRDFNPILEEDE